MPDKATSASGMSRVAVSGAATLVAASLAMRALNLVGQVVLGAILLDEDFGLFAIATSIAAFVLILQDGGMQTLLVQRGGEAYQDLEGPAFWLGTLFNLAAGALLAALAPVIATLYGEPTLAPMLWFIAASIPLASVSAVAMARLRMDLRFGTLATIEVMHAIVRYGGMMAFAAAGFGALAFVASLPIAAVLTGVVATLVTRRTPWMRRPDVRRWPGLLSASGWLIASSLAGSALYLGTHMSLGLTASTSQVGIFFFGYSFVQQSGHLIISNAERILLPILSRLRSEPDRLRSVAGRSLRAVAILSFAVSVMMGSLFAPLEALLWAGKWASAVTVVWIMAIAYPLFVLHVVARCVVTGQGRFRAHALSVGLAGLVLMSVAAVAGRVGPDATWAGSIIAVGMVLVSLAYLAWGMGALGLHRGVLMNWIAPVAACAIAALLTGILADRLAHWAVMGGRDALPDSLRYRLVASGVRVAVAGTVCALVLAAGLRVFVYRGLVECTEVLPDRFARSARKWLRL